MALAHLIRQAARPAMRHTKRHPLRTQLDLSDPRQVRLVRKRLRLSASDLVRIAGKSGNSLATIEKEAELERVRRDEGDRASTIAQTETAETVTTTQG